MIMYFDHQLCLLFSNIYGNQTVKQGYNPFLVYCNELASGTVSLQVTGPRATTVNMIRTINNRPITLYMYYTVKLFIQLMLQ